MSSGSTEPPSSIASLRELATSIAPPSLRSIAPLGLFLLAIVGLLYFARSVFVPLVFALMLSFLLGPLVSRIERGLRLPRALGAALVVLGLVAAIVLCVSRLAEPAAEWIRRSPVVFQTLERKVRPLRRPVRDVSVLAEKVERMAQVSDRDSREVTLEKPGVLGTALDVLWQFAAGALVLVIALYFTLLSGEGLLRRLIAWLPHLNDKRRAAEVIASVQREMSRYLRTVVLINLALGACMAFVFHWLALPNPLLFGVMVTVVNFVPYLGALVGVITVAAVSLVSFAQLSDALLPPLVYLIITCIEGNVITPLILGRTFRLDALVVFVWLLFCAWLWGVAGAVVAVPLLVLIRLTCERSPALLPISTLIASEGEEARAPAP